MHACLCRLNLGYLPYTRACPYNTLINILGFNALAEFGLQDFDVDTFFKVFNEP